ncbi:hypothetical protein ADM96_26445 [Burkholderia sp. ST111]|nr:hypothetical protein ADM96_26445 [Burkholderia sp. ST111]
MQIASPRESETLSLLRKALKVDEMRGSLVARAFLKVFQTMVPLIESSPWRSAGTSVIEPQRLGNWSTKISQSLVRRFAATQSECRAMKTSHYLSLI